MIEKILEITIRKPKWCIFAAIVVTVVLLFDIQNLRTNATPFFIAADHPSRQSSDRIRELFDNSGPQAVITLKPSSGNVFDLYTISTVRKIDKEVREIEIVGKEEVQRFHEILDQLDLQQFKYQFVDGFNENNKKQLNSLIDEYKDSVRLSKYQRRWLGFLAAELDPIGKVNSIASVENVTASNETLLVEPLINTLTENPESLSSLRSATLDNPLFTNTLINSSATATNIQIEMNLMDDDGTAIVKLYNKLEEITKMVDFDGEIYLTGAPVVSAQLDSTMQKDNMILLPFVMLLICLSLYLCFRRIQAVVIPLSISVLTILWTVGAMSIMGVEVNIVTTSLPVFLMTIAVADSIHFLSSYYARRSLGDSKEVAILCTGKKLFIPLLMTSVTTAFGFIALANTNLVAVQEFGIFVAIGVAFAFVITFLLLPSWLSLSNIEFISTKSIDDVENNIFSRLSLTVFRLSFRNPGMSCTIIIILLIILTWGASKISVEYEFVGSFSDSTRLHRDNRAVEQLFGGSLPVSMWFSSKSERAFIEPENLKAIESINNYILKQPEVSTVVSPVEFLKRIQQVFNSTEYAFPPEATREMIGQYFLMYELGSGSELREVADTEYRNIRTVIFSNADQATVWQDLIRRIKAHAETVLPEGVSLKFAGTGELIVSNVLEVTHGQINSLFTSIILIGVVMILLMRSFVLGIVSLIPLIFTLTASYAFMAAIEMPLDLGASLVSGIAFGIGIDYAIHLLVYYRQNSSQIDDRTRIENALTHISRPIAVNSISVALGFAVLCLSSYSGLQSLGLLVSCTMVICGLLTLLCLPPILLYIAPRRVVWVSEAKFD